MTVQEIKIYFDTICPWCYIGHKNLTKALDIYQKTYPGGSSDTFTFVLLSYELRPDLLADSDSLPWNETVARKNGDERVNAIKMRLQRVGESVGIEFSFNNKIGNTRDSHRLIWWTIPEKQKELLEAIYHMHFEQDGDINSRKDLVKAAKTIGVDEDEVWAFLESGEGADEIDSLASKSRKYDGVSSVPTVEIGGRRIEGAVDVSEFYEALVAAKEASKTSKE